MASILYQIHVEGPSCSINGPHQGDYQHTRLVASFLGEFPGDREALITLVDNEMKHWYHSDWTENSSALHCMYVLTRTPILKPGVLLSTSEIRFPNLNALCGEIIHAVKVANLLEERKELKKKLKIVEDALLIAE